MNPSNIRYSRYTRFLFILLDIIVIISIFFLLFYFFNKIELNDIEEWKLVVSRHYKALIYIVLSWLIVGYFSEIYNIYRFTTRLELINKFTKQILLFSLVAIPLIAGIGTIKENLLFNYKVTLFYVFIVSILTYVFRRGLIFLLKKYRSYGGNHRKSIIVGFNKDVRKLERFFKKRKDLGYEFLGFFTNKEMSSKSKKIDNIEKLGKYIEEKEVLHEIFFVGEEFNKNELRDLITLAENNNKVVKIITKPSDIISQEIEVSNFDYIPIVSFKPYPYEDKVLKFLKRIFDLVFSITVITFLLSWLIPVVSIIVKCTSKGPIFYRQTRMGLNGKPFKIIKFRSMYIDAEARGPALSSGEDDPRITPWGKIMRKYRIDELPQFFNVLFNDMSMVGPRPERKFYIDQIIKETPRYKRLENVKPGITSLGQVLFGYAENLDEMRKRARYDLLYLKNYSLWMDIKVIYLTIEVIIKGKGK